MDLAFITPTAYLQSMASKGQIHLVLAHLVLKDEKYREFYKKEEKYKILDNGAFELGQPMPVEQILEAAEMIGAHEVVAPDVFNNGQKTIEAVNNFICQVHTLIPAFKNKHFNFKVMAVPHGKDFIDWLKCFEELYYNARVDVIGIGYKSCKTFSDMFTSEDLSVTRKRLVRLLATKFPNKTIHLLGGGSNPVEACFYRDLKMVRSMDTKLPFVAGSFRQTFDPVGGWIRQCFDTSTNTYKPGEPILDFATNNLDEEQTEIALYNMGIMEGWRLLHGGELISA